MSTKWDTLFGENLYLNITNEERKYLALEPIQDNFELSQYYSKTNLFHKRTNLFWDGDRIVKIISEEKKVSDKGDILFESILEYDTDIKTQNREFIVPLTARGKLKKLTPTNVLACSISGCSFYFERNHTKEKSPVDMYITGQYSKSIYVGEWERRDKIHNDSEFHEFMKYYIETCPQDYFDKIYALKNAQKEHIKFEVGDVFRFEIDRFRYAYGVIIGKISDILNWEVLPERHSFRTLMTVPIMVRCYEIFTENKNMTVEELSDIPLGRMNICSDSDIIYGACEIIGHKKLEENDIEFNLICSKTIGNNTRFTTTSQHTLIDAKVIDSPPRYDLFIEWGTSTTTLLYEDMTDRLKEYMADFKNIYGGVSLGVGSRSRIFANKGEEAYFYKYDLLNSINLVIPYLLTFCLLYS